MPFVVALRDLMLSWQGLERRQLMPEITEDSWVQRDERELITFKRELTRVYTGTFYKFFGKPPIIPHNLLLRVDIM